MVNFIPERSPFHTGYEIEVNSNEDGFRGAWYGAKITDSPPKTDSKTRRKFQVEYKHLVTGDGSTTPLKELVDPVRLRPPPPEKQSNQRVFEENDVIEAKYRDGWWTGTVKKVLENGKFRVFIGNATDTDVNVIDFDKKDLRVHFEWVNGKWVRPGKQLQRSIFSSGTSVEVDLYKEGDFWFPAVVMKENPDGTFLVKCQNSGEKLSLDSQNIRPAPLASSVHKKSYELLEKVDAFYASAWRSGVVTKIVAGGRYIVFFKQGDEDMEFGHSDLRPHVEWNDAEGIRKPNAASAVKPPCSRKHPVEFSTPCHDDDSTPSKKKMKLANSNGCENSFVGRKIRIKSPLPPSVTVTGNDSNGRVTEMPKGVVVGLKASKEIIGGTVVQNLSQILDEEPMEPIKESSRGGSHRRKSAKPCKFVPISQDEGIQHKEVGGAADDTLGKVHLSHETQLPSVLNGVETREASAEKTVEVSEVVCVTKEVDAVSNIAAEVGDDQPLSAWVCSKAKEIEVDVLKGSSAIDVPMENQENLPFVKKSPIWKTIEAMEVFLLMPQHPHFRPLEEAKEVSREGSAIGIMITYAEMFEKITKLQCDDSTSVFLSTLEDLIDLEKHGFDVKVLQDRVNELLSFRDAQGRLLEESKCAEIKVVELTDEKIKLEEKMEDIQKKISELQDQLESSKLNKEAKDVEIARLQSIVEAANVRVQNARRDFGNVAASPWTSS